MAKKKNTKPQETKKFGAFTGVFVPTFLSIIGVILYLRLGYIVGAGGLLQTVIIILLTLSVTVATGLSLSSIVTTIRIGPGGAYSVIAKTLGLEVGGSVGIPLVLAQIFSVALYVFGFAEGWQYIFPGHPIHMTAYVILAILMAMTIINVSVAVRAQSIVFILILASLVSIFVGNGDWWATLHEVPLNYRAEEVPFWALFALFFPAVTGLMAGIGLSGELTDPKKQIPRGVISALGITTLIYIAVAAWLSQTATPHELVQDNLIILHKSAWSSVVVIGILVATFSSALTTFVAAPRLMSTLGENSILPLGNFFAAKTKRGEPGNAILFTTVIVFLSLTFGSLNSVAPLLTMFFLITYAILNLAVFTELALGLVSFRPTLKIPKIIPLYGFVGSIIFMFLINPIAGIIALVFLFSVYIWLVQKKLKPKEGDVRSGLFVTIAEWAAKQIIRLPESTKHTWKPNVLVPVLRTRTLLGNFSLIKALAYPNGTMTVLGVDLKKGKPAPDAQDLTEKEIAQELSELPDLVTKFGKEGIFTSSSVIQSDDYTEGISIALEAMESQVFHPNILFLPFKPEELRATALGKLFARAKNQEAGVILFDRDEDIGLGSEQDIHVWISPNALNEEFYEDRKFDLSLLSAYQLYRNWNGRITLWMCVDKDDRDRAYYYLKKLVYEARFPGDTEINVSTKTFHKTLHRATAGDIHIISVTGEDVKRILSLSKRHHKSFLFILDSAKEDVLG